MLAECEVQGCSKPAYTRKLCMAHYRRLLRNGGPEVNKKISFRASAINKKFNMLTVIEEVEEVITEKGVKKRMALCKCDCGKSKVIEYHRVMAGKIRSCGCVRGTHKLSALLGLRASHNAMKQRCYNKNNPAYKYYGAKGVTICEEWHTFAGFAKDMLATHVPGLTIERLNPFGNYCKENCLWIPKSEQGNNKRKNVYIEFNGLKYNLSRWAREYGIDRWVLHKKIKSGIPFEEIIENLTKQS